jgi:hypothetical protein
VTDSPTAPCARSSRSCSASSSACDASWSTVTVYIRTLYSAARPALHSQWSRMTYTVCTTHLVDGLPQRRLPRLQSLGPVGVPAHRPRIAGHL